MLLYRPDTVAVQMLLLTYLTHDSSRFSAKRFAKESPVDLWRAAAVNSWMLLAVARSESDHVAWMGSYAN